MGAFFTELAKKLAERWVTLLLIPGALLTAVVAIGLQVGQQHALDRNHLNQAVIDTATTIARQPTSIQAMLVIAVLLTATGAGLVVQALAGLTRLLWLGPWPRPLTPLRRWRVASRRDRWTHHVDRRRQLEQDFPQQSRTPDQQQEIDTAAERANRVAMAQPARPTWMGDRVHAVEKIALDRYGLDLAFGWPRLWLVLPDTTRAAITAAHGAFAAAIATATWAWPYLLLGVLLWWPAALAGIGIGLTGWVRARAAITDLTALSEAALDLHARTLAITLGLAKPDSAGPLTITEGEQITALIRKGR